MKISEVIAFQILDSRGRPTIAASVVLEDGSRHTARVPSGASTGKHEAIELRDHGTSLAEPYYRGNSVLTAVANVNQLIAPRLIGQAVSLLGVDSILMALDESENHSQLGANAKLAVSIATAKAEAYISGRSLARHLSGPGKMVLPMPMINILSGGAHANRSMDIQDLLVIPKGASSFSEALAWVCAIRERAAIRGRELGYVTHLIADEGGLGIPLTSIEDACEFVTGSIEDVGLRPGIDVSLALDFASTQYFSDGKYHLANEGLILNPTEYLDYVLKLVANQPIISIEDPFAEDDWESWQLFSSAARSDLQVLGDDLFTTNLRRLERGIDSKSANAILIKVNQNGLVSNTLEVLQRAKRAGYKTVVSARSGETEDSWLSDLAVGWRAEQIKVGSTHGSDRTAKWNRLLELEAIEDIEFARPF